MNSVSVPDLFAAALQAIRETPTWAILILVALPTVLALGSGRALLTVSAALLSVGSALSFLPDAQPLVFIGGLLSAFALALFGISERRRTGKHADLAKEVASLHEQVNVFLDALDRRAASVEKREQDARARNE